MSEGKNIRIKDIAKMAGVSVGTVDRVIHSRGSVSKEVEQKIQQILEETGYTADPIARSLGTTKDYQIAVMIPDPGQDKYWELASTGVRRAKEKWKSYNLHIHLFTFDLYDAASFSTTFENILHSQPDAVLSVPMFYEQSLDFFQQLHQADIPYILFNTQLEAFTPMGFIGPDLYQSGRVAAGLMSGVLPAGTRVAVLHIHENIESSMHLKEKERGFRAYFKEHEPAPDITSHSLRTTHEPVAAQIGHIVEQEAYKGIFVSTSSAASTTARVLEEQQSKEVFLIGYDLLEQNIHYLQAGTINFLINQNPQYQTFQGLRYLANHLLLDNAIPAADLLPINIITTENYRSFLNVTDTNFL